MTTEHGMLVLYCFKNRFNVVSAFVTVFDQLIEIYHENMS